MEDREIVDMFFARDERALAETQRRYGSYCRAIAMRILHCEEDADECVNDTWRQAWGAMPPHRPERLATFLGKITRRLSLDRAKEKGRGRRGGGELSVALDELVECLPDTSGGDTVDDLVLREALNAFVKALPSAAQRIFVQRYWYLCPVADIARDNGMRESAVKMSLLRTRERLKKYLEKEGIYL